MAEPREIKIRLVRSLIGTPEKHRRVAKSLGLYKINQEVKHLESRIILGMIRKISHLIKVEAA